MSTPLALQDILVSIADSLSQAQQQLSSMPPYDSFGRPNTLYQLPYLDLNIVLSAKFDIDESTPETIDNDTNSSFKLDRKTLLKTRRIYFSALKKCLVVYKFFAHACDIFCVCSSRRRDVYAEVFAVDLPGDLPADV